MKFDEKEDEYVVDFYYILNDEVIPKIRKLLIKKRALNGYIQLKDNLSYEELKNVQNLSIKLIEGEDLENPIKKKRFIVYNFEVNFKKVVSKINTHKTM